MGQQFSSYEPKPNADYSRLNGKSPPKAPKKKTEKELTATELAGLLPFLEKSSAAYQQQIEILNSAPGQWEAQYRSITDGDGSPAVASNAPQHAALNRYRNIVAYDHSRVKVTPNAHNGNSDYVNACFVPGFKQEKAYIAAQGPVPAGFNAYWQMIWESGVKGIVMITNEIEGNKLKCHRYWPSREEPTMQYGEVQVVLKEERPHSTYIHRTFQVSGPGSKTAEKIEHFQYTVWPDHGVPNTTSEILGFRKAVRKVCPEFGHPLCVHCSAGVGRTGSFIVIDTMLSRGEALSDQNNVHGLVKEIRCSRNYLVQTLIQYQFCHRTMLDATERAIARTVRAIRQTKNTVMEQAQHDLDELQADVAETLDSYVGPDESTFLTIGRKAGRGIVPDVKHTFFDPATDVAPASAVPPQVRLESLAASGDLWRVRGNVPLSPEEHGYNEKRSSSLGQRVESLQISSDPDAWRSRYAEVVDNWVAEVYDVTAALNPLESRMMSLASQNDSWKLRGKHFRDAIMSDSKKIKVSYEQRLTSLEIVLKEKEKRWKTRGDGMRGEVQNDDAGSLSTVEDMGDFQTRFSRLEKWASDSGTRVGTTEGRIVDNPVKVAEAAALRRQKEAAERRAMLDKMEAEQLAKTQAEMAARKAEAARKAAPPVRATGLEKESNVTAKQMVQLKKTEKAPEVHPMVAAAANPVKIKKSKSPKKKQ